MTTLKTLLVQARLDWQDPDRNRERLGRMLESAEDAFDLAVLPETFTTGFLGDADLPGEGMDGPTVAWMREQAARHGSALAGSAVITEHGNRYNRMLFVTPDGEVRHYDKRHRFAFGGESRRYTGGDVRVVVDFHGWRINLQVCYDLRFPVWCRNRGDYGERPPGSGHPVRCLQLYDVPSAGEYGRGGRGLHGSLGGRGG